MATDTEQLRDEFAKIAFEHALRALTLEKLDTSNFAKYVAHHAYVFADEAMAARAGQPAAISVSASDVSPQTIRDVVEAILGGRQNSTVTP